MKNERRVALLGAGFIADFHLRALARVPGARVAWVCDADRAKAQALAAKAPGAQAIGSIDELVAAKPDVVHVLLPPAAHAAAAIACLGAGAHVFVEKPLGTSQREVAAIGAAAEAAGRSVGVNHNVVFNPTFRKLVGAIRARKMGALEHVAFTWNVPLRQLTAGQHGHWMFREPRNLLLEQAVHPLSTIQHLLGDLRALSVLPAEPTTLSTGATIDRAWQVSLVLARGTAQLFMGFGREQTDIRLHAIGQDAIAMLDFRRNAFSLAENGTQEPPLDDLVAGVGEGVARASQAIAAFRDTMLGMLKLKPPFDPFGESMAGSIAAFHAAIGEGRRPPVGLEAGASVISMCEAIGAAAESARPREERVG